MKLKKINKRAQMPSFTIFTFIIFSFLVVVFFAGLIYFMSILNTTFHDVGVMNDAQPHPNITSPCLNDPTQMCTGNYYVNMTLASDQIFGSQYESIKALRMVAVVYILGLAVVIIITNVFIRKHPILFFAYILIGILAVVFAPPISNAYEELLASGIFAGELQNFSAANFLLLNLPVVVLVIVTIGGILGFINLIRVGGESTEL